MWPAGLRLQVTLNEGIDYFAKNHWHAAGTSAGKHASGAIRYIYLYKYKKKKWFMTTGKMLHCILRKAAYTKCPARLSQETAEIDN